MASYKSEEVTILAPVRKVYATLSNTDNLHRLLENIPEDKIPEQHRDVLKQIVVDGDRITIAGGPTGSIVLEVSRRQEPDLIELTGVGLPISIKMTVSLFADTEESCKAGVQIDADIPMMLRPMVAGPLQKAADQFARLLAGIPYNSIAD